MIQKIHSKKPVFKAKFFTVNELNVEVKPTVKRVHHNIERLPTVHILPITDAGEVVLVSQYRYNHGKEVLECVAGFIEEGEEPLQAAKRELQEETGLSAINWYTLPTQELGAGNILSKMYMYIASNFSEGKSSFDESEDVKTVRMPLTDALDKIHNGEINVNGSVSLLLFAHDLMQKGVI